MWLMRKLKSVVLGWGLLVLLSYGIVRFGPADNPAIPGIRNNLEILTFVWISLAIIWFIGHAYGVADEPARERD